MSYQSRLTRWVTMGSPDLALAKVGILLSVLLLSLRLLAAQPFLVVIPVATGTACSVYVVLHDRQIPAVGTPALPGVVIDILPAAVVAGLGILILQIRAVGARTWPAYLLIGAIGTLLLAQILFVNEERLAARRVLVQILAASVVIRLIALYITPGFVGVDIWTHIPVFIEGIAGDGSLAALADSKYLMAPLYHTTGAVAALVFGSARTGVYLTLGVLVSLSAVFIYLTAALLLSTRWALLATALYVFADQFIRWGLHIIPTSLGLVFFLAALYCVTRAFVTDDGWSVPLLFVFSLAVVFTHQVSTGVMLVVLGIAAGVAVAGARLGWRSGGTSPPALALSGVFLVTLVVTVASWAVTPWSGGSVFLWRMLSILRETVLTQAGFLNLAGGGSAAAASSGLVSQLVPFVELTGFAILLAAAVVGGLWMLRWDRTTAGSYTHILAAGTMFVIVFGLSLFGVRALLPGRWIAFMYAPLAVMAATGLYYVARNAPRGAVLAIFVVLAVGYPATMVVAEKATLDSPAFEEEYPRFAYTEPEINAVASISEVHPASVGETIYSDHPYQTIFEPLGGYDARTVEIGDAGTVSPGPVVYREYQATAPVSFDRPEGASGVAPALDESTVCQPGRNVVYANEEVRLCTPPVTEGGE